MIEKILYYIIKYTAYLIFRLIAGTVRLFKGKEASEKYIKKVDSQLGLSTASIFCRDNSSSFDIGFFAVNTPEFNDILRKNLTGALYLSLKDDKKYSRIYSIKPNRSVTKLEENPFRDFILEINLKEKENNFPELQKISSLCFKGREFKPEQPLFNNTSKVFIETYNLILNRNQNLEHYVFRELLINELLQKISGTKELEIIKLLLFSNKIIRITSDSESFNPEKEKIFVTYEHTPFYFSGTANILIAQEYQNFWRINLQHTGHGVNGGPNYKVVHRLLFNLFQNNTVEEDTPPGEKALTEASEKISLKKNRLCSVKSNPFKEQEFLVFHLMNDTPDTIYQEIRTSMQAEGLNINYTTFDFLQDLLFFNCRNITLPFILREEALTFLEASDNTQLYVKSIEEPPDFNEINFKKIHSISEEISNLKDGNNPTRLLQYSNYYFPAKFLNFLYLTAGRLYTKTREKIFGDFLYSNLASLKGEEALHLALELAKKNGTFWLYFKGSSVNVSQLKATKISKAIAPTEYGNYAISYKIDPDKLEELFKQYPEKTASSDFLKNLEKKSKRTLQEKKLLLSALYTSYLKSRKIPF